MQPTQCDLHVQGVGLGLGIQPKELPSPDHLHLELLEVFSRGGEEAE